MGVLVVYYDIIVAFGDHANGVGVGQAVETDQDDVQRVLDFSDINQSNFDFGRRHELFKVECSWLGG
jgi:hypothetical protein